VEGFLYRFKINGHFIFILVDKEGNLLANGVPHSSMQTALELIKRHIPQVKNFKIEYMYNENKYRFIAQELFRLFQGKDVRYRFNVRFLDNNPLRLRVLKAVKKIPRGKVASYSLVASYLGVKSPRVIGKMLMKNPFPLIYPCHRVVYKNGYIGGYLGSKSLWYIKAGILLREGVPLKDKQVSKSAFIEKL